MTDSKIIIKKIRELFGTKIISGVNIINDFPRHIHIENYCIGFIDKGKRKFTVNGFSKVLGENDFFIINPNDPHECDSYYNKPHSYKVLCIPLKLIESIGKEFLKGLIHSINFKNFLSSNNFLLNDFKELIDLINNSKYKLEIQTKFYSFIEKIILNHSNINRINYNEPLNSKYHFIEKAQNYIDKNFKSDISLNKLSKLVNISPFYLNRLFSLQIGVSLHSYHLQLKIEKSKKFLLKNHSIAEAAYEVGFTDQSHYTKFFKKIIGVTPSVFVKFNKSIK